MKQSAQQTAVCTPAFIVVVSEFTHSITVVCLFALIAHEDPFNMEINKNGLPKHNVELLAQPASKVKSKPEKK
jgi:hypothetical protein